MTARNLIAVVGLALVTLPVRAQFSQYTPPGSLSEPTVRSSERVRAEAEEARWRFGKLRVDPRVWVLNSGYRDNVFSEPEGSEQQSDLTATVGMGLVSFLNLGPKVIASAHLLPEYVWWQELDELRSLNGSYGIEVVGLFNRLTVETEAYTHRRESPLNSEVEIPVTGRNDGASAAFRVDLGSRLAAFASAAKADIENKLEDPAAAPEIDLSPLDRKESVLTGGLAYDITRTFELSLGVQYRETDFENDLAARGSTGTSPLLGLELSRKRFQIDLTAVDRELEFGPESTIGSASAIVGRLRAAWILSPQIDLAAYGGRNLVYSVRNAESIYLESRWGAAIESSFARRFQLRVFIESGENDYTTVISGVGDRIDDISTWGVGLRTEILRGLALRVGASRSKVDSAVQAANRQVSSVVLNLDLAGERLFRRPSQ